MVMMLEMDRIIVDSRLQIRSQMDEEKIKEYATLMKEKNVDFPPLSVGYFPSGRPDMYYLIDGFHRYEAAKRLNAKAIWVKQKTYHSMNEMYIDALRYNVAHGLPLTREEKTDAIATIILQNQNATLKELSRWCGVSKSTVARIRKELSQMGKLKLDGTTTGEDGKQRKQKYAERKAVMEPEAELRAEAEPEDIAPETDAEPEPEAERKAVMEQEVELRAGSGPEDDEPEPEMEGGNEAEGEITREPEPEPEPDPGANPKMVRCAICSRKATLEAATFHASSWIYDADSFDSEKMTWTRWFCCVHCEALRDDLLTINERMAENLAEDLVEDLRHHPFGYRDPENVQAILTRALELYCEKAKGIIKK